MDRHSASSRLSRIAHWEPGPAQRRAVVLAGLAAVVLVGLLHLATGPALEFHAFYLLPVILVAWYAGHAAGLLLVLASIAGWIATDWSLRGGEAFSATALFNEAVRLAVLLWAAAVSAELRRVLRREAELARLDPLTRLANRRMFYEAGRRELGLAQRQGQPVTVMFLDLDDFKAVNDTQGHQAGDALLRAVADGLGRAIRASDLAGRLGGDEFALLLPGMGAEAAAEFAARLRADLLERLAAGGWSRVGVSLGVVSYAAPPADFDAVVARADALMYEVKAAGKNAVRQRMVGAGEGA